jgi:uncharacterized protein (DUF885 family)
MYLSIKISSFKKTINCFASLSLAFTLSACSTTQTSSGINSAEQKLIIGKSSNTANELFETIYQQWVSDSPMSQAYLGRKTQYDQWDDLSPEHSKAQFQQSLSQRALLDDIDPQTLDPQTQLSLTLLKYKIDNSIKFHPFIDHGYPISHMGGLHTQIPSFLMNIHQINSIEDANNYIKRIQGVKPLIKQLLNNIKDSEKTGYHLPPFEFPRLITTVEASINGYPFTKTKKNAPLWNDFANKVDELDIYDDSKAAIKKRARKAFKRNFFPAYKSLLKHLKNQQKANLYTGYIDSNYYQLLLNNYTTQSSNANELHSLGLSEVARIHNQINLLLPALNKTKNTQLKDLKDLFDYTRTNKQLYLTDTPENRAAFLNQAREYITSLTQKLPEYFAVLPDSTLTVKAVEEYRESASPIAFYQRPSTDNKRPGRFYTNLSLMEEFPLHRLAALPYHESVPGHHFEISLAQQQTQLPTFRRNLGYSAFSEGWGLYAEYLAKEMGGYKTPWEEFGRLSMELWRAVRLVLDTGLNNLHWSPEHALDYRLANTPFTEPDSINAIERYIVMPGQAVSYKTGMLEIMSRRSKAELALGRFFDIKEFHQQVLQNGPLPLPLLKKQISDWIEHHQRPDFHQWMPDALLPERDATK